MVRVAKTSIDVSLDSVNEAAEFTAKDGEEEAGSDLILPEGEP